MVSSRLQGGPRKKELVPRAGRMRVRYEEGRPDSEGKTLFGAGRLRNPLSWRPFCKGETCLRDEDRVDYLVLGSKVLLLVRLGRSS